MLLGGVRRIAAIDTVVSLAHADACGRLRLGGRAETGEYGVPEGLQFGFPVVSDGQGGWSVVEGLGHDEFATERIQVTTDELLGERDDVQKLGLI